MDAFLEIGLNNAIFATCLAVFVAVIARVWAKPGMLHALWVIILFKLITPPLIPVDLSLRASDPQQERSSQPAREPEAELRVTVGSEGRRSVELSSERISTSDVSSPLPRELVLPFAPAIGPETNRPSRVHKNGAGTNGRPADRGKRDEQVPATVQRKRSAPVVLHVSPLWAYAWLTGTVLCLCGVAVRVWTFHRCLKLCSPAQELQQEVEDLAKRIGLRRSPTVLIVPGRVAPMLWTFGARSRLIFPSALLGRLDRAARATLLLHELSHLRRGDHRIRWLEVLATAFYWWLPIVWWVRRRLHEVEEECCDGFVLSELPGAREIYANALLIAVADVPGRTSRLPLIASGIGDFDSIKRRLTGIMLGPAQRGLSWQARVGVICMALVLVPFLPSLARIEFPGRADGAGVSASAGLQSVNAARHRELVTIDKPQRNADGTERLVPPAATIRMPDAGAVVALFSPDGGSLLAGDDRGELQFWNLHSGEIERTISSGAGVSSAAISPNDEFVATGHSDGSLRLWGPRGDRALRFSSVSGAIATLDFTPDGRFLIGCVEPRNGPGRVELWDSRSLRPVRSLGQDQSRVRAVAIDGSETIVVVTGNPKEPAGRGKVLIHAPNGRQSIDLGLPAADFTAVSATLDGRVLAAADSNNQIHFWDRHGNALRSITHAGSAAMDLAISPRGDLLAAVEADGRVGVWDVASGSPHVRFEGHSPESRRLSPPERQYSIAFSPDGSTIATTGPDGLLKLWTLEGSPPSRTIQTDAYLYSLAISPNGRHLLAGGSAGATLWDLDAGPLIGRLPDHGKAVATAISPDGRWALTSGEDHALFLWDLETGEQVRRLDGHTAEVRCAAFSPDGRTVASCGYDQLAMIWDVESGREVQRLTGHRDRVNVLAFSPDGRFLATGDTFSLRIWSLAAAREPIRIQTPSPVGAVCFSPDGSQVLAGLNDASVRVWDAGSGDQLQHFRGHSKPLETVAFSTDGSYAVSAGQDNQLLLWSPNRSTPVCQLAAGGAAIKGVRFTPDGRRLVTAGADGCIRIWDLTAVPDSVTIAHYIRQWGRSASVPRVRVVQPRETVVADQQRASFVQFSPNGRLLATGGSDGVVRLWDAGTLQFVFALGGHTAGITSGAFSSDGRYLITGSWAPDNALRVWDVEDRKLVSVLSGHSGPIRDVAVSPNGRLIASGSEDGTARLWDLPTGNRGTVALEEFLPVFSVAISPDGETLAAGTGGLEPYRPGRVFLCDLAGTRKLRSVDSFMALQSDLAFSPDGRFLSAKKREGVISWWDLALNCQGPELRGAAGPLVYSPDGASIASGCLDGTVQVWSTASGQVTAELRGHDAQVRALTFAPDGKTLAAAAQDGLVRLWDLPYAD